MNKIFYFKIVELAKDFNKVQVWTLDYELKLYSLAVFLKNKFKDKRSVLQLINLITEEYGLKHKTPKFLIRSFLYDSSASCIKS